MISPQWYNEDTVCKAKRRYKTLISAAKAAAEVDRRNDLRDGRDTRPISVYECTLCGGYHWGHLPINGRETRDPNKEYPVPGQQTLFSFSSDDDNITYYHERRRKNNQRYKKSVKRRKNPDIAFGEFREWVNNRGRV